MGFEERTGLRYEYLMCGYQHAILKEMVSEEKVTVENIIDDVTSASVEKNVIAPHEDVPVEDSTVMPQRPSPSIEGIEMVPRGGYHDPASTSAEKLEATSCREYQGTDCASIEKIKVAPHRGYRDVTYVSIEKIEATSHKQYRGAACVNNEKIDSTSHREYRHGARASIEKI
ncbi:hypothetical protein ARMSODRAFT_976179 [Armillaria solidipes]|uniref:Uncharacterized protein n=1 Tax=Armillaria solidipes TaxID=1076256 RepID=A0A2H3BWU2_9AGAR|nr:hypothetical protein ARMSODRAFT_976179 [Armillaria solidipes]